MVIKKEDAQSEAEREKEESSDEEEDDGKELGDVENFIQDLQQKFASENCLFREGKKKLAKTPTLIQNLQESSLNIRTFGSFKAKT